MPMPRDFDLLLVQVDYLIRQKKDYQWLKNAFKQAAVSIALKGAEIGVNAAAQGLGPLTMVLTPWMNAGSVYMSAQSYMDLYDLLPDTRPINRDKEYPCVCPQKKCAAAAKFAIDRMDKSFIKKAISASVVGAPFVAGYTVSRNLYKWGKGIKGVTRNRICQELVASARPMGGYHTKKRKGKLVKEYKVLKPGCPKAQAAISILLKEIKIKKPSPYPMDYKKTIAAICASDGWLQIKKAM